MGQMIASWSMVMAHGLMAAGPGNLPHLSEIVVVARPTRRAEHLLGLGNQMCDTLKLVRWPVLQPKRLKRKFISQLTGLGPFQCPAYAPSSAENGQVGRL